MIIYEPIHDDLVHAYSDRGVYIHGGDPEADYEEAIDPADKHRTYVETDIPIPVGEPGEEPEEEPEEEQEEE